MQNITKYQIKYILFILLIYLLTAAQWYSFLFSEYSPAGILETLPTDQVAVSSILVGIVFFLTYIPALRAFLDTSSLRIVSGWLRSLWFVPMFFLALFALPHFFSVFAGREGQGWIIIGITGLSFAIFIFVMNLSLTLSASFNYKYQWLILTIVFFLIASFMFIESGF